MDILEKEHSFDLPQGILEQEFKDIWHRLDHAKKDGTLDEDDKKLNEDQNLEIAIISDAGTPAISDHGYHLIQECINHKINFSHIP